MPGSTCWIAILFGSLCAGHVANAASLAQDDGVGAAATAPVEGDLPNLSEIQKDIEAIRGLQFKHDVPAERQSIEEFREVVDRDLDQMFPTGFVENMQLGLYRLGMLTEPRDLLADVKHAYASQIGAYYDPKIKQFFYVMTDMPLQELKVMASHELVHALQDQHFDLQTRMDDAIARDLAGPRNDDLNLVLTSLVEGEATYVMTLWERLDLSGVDLTQDRIAETEMFSMMAAIDTREMVAMMEGIRVDPDNQGGQVIAALAEIPPYILEPLYASYMKGAYFVMHLRQHGGWPLVTRAFDAMPESSEQILHPEKFTTDRDDPTPLLLPQFSGLPTDAWTTLDRAVHGEFYLNILLRNLNCGKVAAERAAAGWDGDIYAAYRHADGATIVVVLATTWDTRRDALQFFEAYKSVLPTKYQRIEAIIDADREFVYDAGMPLMGRGRLVRRGREVFIVEGGSADLNASIAAELHEMVIEQVQ